MKTLLTILVAALMGCPLVTYSQSWSINGNAHTIPGVNFLGTTDAEPLVFRVDNFRAGYISYSDAPGNTGLGYGVLQAITSGTLNSAFGHKALYSCTIGLGNTAVGFKALYTNTTGSYNTAIGAQTLPSSTASFNTAAGYAALYANTTGTQNVAVGYKSLFTNKTSSYNAALGYESLYNNTGSNNSAFGYLALFQNTTGHDNTAAGFSALGNNSTGSNNTAVGEALSKCITGSNNTAVGNIADMTGDYSNTTTIGYQATATGSNQVRIGNASVTSIGGYEDWSNISDGRFKKNVTESVKGLAFINQLRPVTYNLDVTGLSKALNEDRSGQDATSIASDDAARSEKEKIVYTGFIAQEVEAAATKVGYNFSGVDKPAGANGLYGLRYAEFVVPLVKAVQELSASNDSIQKSNSMLIQENEQLKSDNDARNERISRLEEMLQKLTIKDQSSSGAQSKSTTFQNLQGRLDQNQPNPFSGKSKISYYVPETTSNAILIIQSEDQKLVKSFVLQPGEGVFELDGSILNAGTYTYSLILDGRVIATRKIIITR